MLTVERWIHATIKRNVKKLDLKYSSKRKCEDMVMPYCLVTCASLEVLRLDLLGRCLILPSFFRFPALRVLQFTSMELFDDDLLRKFLESCPLLEDLTLDYSRLDKLDIFCISCPKLKKLSISVLGDEQTSCLKLSCPELVFLGITGVVASNYIFERLYSLKEAKIAHHNYVIDNRFHTISQLFHGVSRVESLRTDLSFLSKCINAAAHDVALPNLKTLELTTINDETAKEHLIQILKCCPELESLELSIENYCNYNPKDYDATEYPTGRILPPDVKWIEFFEFNGEKPELDICWCDDGRLGEDFIDHRWLCMFAEWGKAAKEFQ